MTERPILFSGPMVRALLDGRKTRTRRICKPGFDGFTWADAVHPARDSGWISWWCGSKKGGIGTAEFTKKVYADGWPCPYGVVGDRLWVRESFAPRYFDDGSPGYAADWTSRASDVAQQPKWKPSIHMPRALSRITLEITDVRVERLQEIATTEEVIAEGVQVPVEKVKRGAVPLVRLTGPFPPADYLRADPKEVDFFRAEFASLWDQINGKRAPWSSNPWVWVVSFKRLEQKTRAA